MQATELSVVEDNRVSETPTRRLRRQLEAHRAGIWNRVVTRP